MYEISSIYYIVLSFKQVILISGGFKSTAKAKLARKRADALQRTANQQLDEPIQNTIQFALSSHKLFKVCILHKLLIKTF